MAFRDDIIALSGVEDTPSLDLEIEAALEYANRFCNTAYTETDAPAGFKKGVAILITSAEQTPNVTSESVAGEISVSYDTNSTASALPFLKPYRRVRW